MLAETGGKNLAVRAQLELLRRKFTCIVHLPHQALGCDDQQLPGGKAVLCAMGCMAAYQLHQV